MCIVTFELNLHIGLLPIVDTWLCYVGRVVQAYKTLTKGYTIEFVLFWGFLRASRIVAKFSCLDGEVLRQDQLCTMFCRVSRNSQKGERLAIICTPKITKYEGVNGRGITTYFYSPTNCSWVSLKQWLYAWKPNLMIDSRQ